MVAVRLDTPIVPASRPADGLIRRNAEHPARRGRSILLVDNDPVTTETVLGALAPAGHWVMCAASPADARRLIESHPFDVVFVSLAGDGLRYMIELKRAGEIPVIAIAGGRDYCQVNYQIRMATALGGEGLLVKPVSVDRARVVLDQALR